MANNLTGDYEAVLQISVRQLNAILATLHQRRIDPAVSPSFEHSGSIRIGESHHELEVTRFQHWVGHAVQALQSTGGSTGNARAVLSAKTPPGVSAVFQRAWNDLDAALVPFAEAVRGKAYFQVASPKISFPTGVVSEVMVTARVRAHYAPEKGSEALPAPIHGEVQAVYRVKPKTLPDGRLVLSVQVSPHDNQIKFKSAVPNQGAADENKISAQVRRALRSRFAPVDVQLPAGFAFSEFKALGGGPSEAVVLPLHLSNAPFPAGGTASLTNHFLGSNEFAIAVSKEYVQTFLDQFIEKVRTTAAALRITASFTFVTAHYTASLTSSSVVWKNGAIEVSGRIDLVTGARLAPNGYITFTQAIAVVLDVPSQTVSVKPLGEPDVDESWWLPHSKAMNEVRNARDKGLAQATTSVNNTFVSARNKLLSGLQSFDIYASVTYAALDVTADGIVVRGAIGSSGRLNPVVDVSGTVTATGPALTAWSSWIPGGWIERFVWSWAQGAAWFSHVAHHDDEHGFVLPPAEVAATGRICLKIEGTRLTADGGEETVTAGEICRPSWSEPILVVPPWWFEAIVPIWIPDWPDLILLDAIAGHLNIVAGSRAPHSLVPNTLIHFAGPHMERPLEGLSRAVSQMRRREHSVLTILVLPAGTFNNRRREVEARLGAVGERFAANNLLITEDYRGGWTKIFSAPDGPSTHLINARGEFVWKQDGTLDARALAAALDEQLLPAPAAHTAPLRLTVQPGERMPDTVFTDEAGNQITLRRLHGQNVLLNFWQSWSAPCIRELRQLQRLQNQERAPLVLAINGGEERTVLADVRGRYNLTFPLIHDHQQSIATQYGVQCWPTTVSINREGIVDHVQFGLTHAHREKEAGA